MTREKAFDLYKFVEDLTGKQQWIERIQVFGSRRYLSNVSYGSDIDLLIYSAEETSTERLRNAIHEPYVDAFLVFGGVATSVANRSQVAINDNHAHNLDAVTIGKGEKFIL